MSLNESDTRAKLIDPALHARGWTENLIRREETVGAIEIVDGRPRKRARGRVDYVLRVAVNAESQSVAVEEYKERLAAPGGWLRSRAWVNPQKSCVKLKRGCLPHEHAR